MLEMCSAFSNIPRTCLQKLEKLSILRQFPKRSVLFTQGESSAHLFVVISGLVCIHLDDIDGRQLILNFAKPGDYFGELSLLDDRPRSASASTLEESVLLRISRNDFLSLVQEYPELYEVLMVDMVRRIRSLTDNVKRMALLGTYGAGSHKNVPMHSKGEIGHA